MNIRPLFAVAALLAFGSAASGQTFFFNNPGAIADGLSGGGYGPARVMAATSNVANPIQDVVVTIAMNHTWVGDLRVRLGYTPTGSVTTTTAFVLNRVGASSSGSVGSSNDVNGTFAFVLGATSFNTQAAATSNLTFGAYAPFTNNFNGTFPVVEFADSFRGLPGTGAWTLTFEDGAIADIGSVTSASIALQARPLPCLADFNTDGVVNTADLTFFLGRFGNACP